MWFLFIYLQVVGIQAQEAAIRTVLRGTDSPCKGRLEVYHKDQWGSVCHHQWKKENGKIVCKSLGCGEHINSGQVNELPTLTTKDLSPLTTMWMDEVACKGTENSIWECDALKWNITKCHRENYIMVECSGTVNLTLNMNGYEDECAGVVQFEIPNGTASVCDSNWNKNTSDMVCKEMACGEHYKTPKSGTFQGKPRAYNVPLSCIGSEMFSWQCVDWVTAKSNTCQTETSIICSAHKSMRLIGGDVCSGVLQEKQSTKTGTWVSVPYNNSIKDMADGICSKLRCGKSTEIKQCSKSNDTCLTCTDRVKVMLKNSCFGEIYVSVNNTNHTVCSDSLNADEQNRIGNVVCKQLGCEKLLTASAGSWTNNHERLSQLDCSGIEDSLWECLAKHEPVGSCTATTVSCAAFEDVKLREGLGRCSGRLEVKFEGSWWRVRSAGWTNINSDVVCKQLGCGKSQTTKDNLFVKSNLPFLKRTLACDNKSRKLSQCLGQKWDSRQDQEATVNIICEEEKLYFLQGGSSCEGRVLVESGGTTVNLTVAEDKWNEMATEVCKQMNCGAALPSPDISHCSANSTSNSTCTKDKATALNVTASVKCTGSIEVKLENKQGEKCWGKVTVCMNGNCGGVCMDTWTKEKSQMLCENLSCGKVLLGQYDGPQDTKVTVGSVHCSKQTEKLSQCRFVLLNQSSCQNPAYVACTGSLKAKLTDSRYKCAGRAELFYFGVWRSVCTEGVSKETQTTICNTVGCGKALYFSKAIQSGLIQQGVSNIVCTSNITTCNVTVKKSCNVGYLKCKDWRRLLITSLEACSGGVYAESEKGLNPVSPEGWGAQEGEKLCQYLQCGKYRNHTEVNPQQIDSLWNNTYKCSGTPQTIWDCEVEGKPTQLKYLSIKCDGNPNISLLGNCTGEVIINQDQRVCWKSETKERVLIELCQQLKCSQLITYWETKTTSNGHNFICSGKENNLWQCSSTQGKCDSVLSLACAGSAEFNFTKKCGGSLQVKYRGSWESVHVKPEDANAICEHKGCGKVNDTYDGSEQTKTIFQCKNKDSHPKHCIKFSSSPENSTRIKCEKFVPEVIVQPVNIALITGVVVGLFFLLLAIVIVIWQRKRFIVILRSQLAAGGDDVELSVDAMQNLNERNGKDLSDRKSSMFEIDDYEDAELIMNPRDDKSKSQELHSAEEKERSASEGSSRTEYDDVEERYNSPLKSESSNPAEPLLPPRPANLQDDISYEVELEELDDYDDAAPVQATLSDPEGGPDPVDSVSSDMSEGPDD
ncbi:scavenger receptor cysteine-rich type 1 protein M130 [Salminus brasiliensis]|uniref:scavenger receptor cysteine-rich type 1 protein M130 n=1 Tax=Salminus brasiliensis TaxID=930266 RepID=UPI003B835BBC